MEKKMDILDREELRRNPYSVPEGYFDRLQERLAAIPRQANTPATVTAPVKAFAAAPAKAARIRPVFATLAGLAAALAACFILIHRPAAPAAEEEETVTYEQLAYADLIPHTDPYIYYVEESQASEDGTQEEILDYLMQSPMIEP